MAAPTTADVRVLDAPDHSRYEVRVGGELAGFAEYRRRPPLIARLTSERPVAARGMAIVELMISNAVESPLYGDAKPGTLRRQVVAATAALELEPEPLAIAA